jgi:hypothetical protein
MDKPLAVAGLIAFAALLATLATVAYRHERRRDHADDTNPGRLDDILPAATVEHHGADEGWSPAADVLDSGDPFTRGLSEIELREPLLFDEIAAAYPVRLDWQPPDFTSEWQTLGAVLADMGQTQALPRIEVAAA